MKLNVKAPAIYYADYHRWKNQAREVAEAGLVPVHPDSPTWDRLDELEYSLDLDWIEYDEYQDESKGVYYECLSIESAKRFQSMGIDFDDVSQFLELFCSP